MWVGGCEGEQAQSRVDSNLGLMHLYRVPLALFVLLGSGCVVLFLLVCTVQWDFSVYLRGALCAIYIHVHCMYSPHPIIPVQLIRPGPLYHFSVIPCFNDDIVIFLGGKSFARVTTVADG